MNLWIISALLWTLVALSNFIRLRDKTGIVGSFLGIIACIIGIIGDLLSL